MFSIRMIAVSDGSSVRPRYAPPAALLRSRFRYGSPASIERERSMTVEQLRIFVAVAERQHVTQAARALNLAQSAVSHAIATLETRHNTNLFDRVGRRIELTEAGRVFLAEARAVLARADAAELALSEFGGLKRGTLSIHA